MTHDAQRRFTEVVVPQTDRAFRLALWLTGSRPDAEDVVQDAALRAFQAIGEFRGSNGRAWFLTIVRRTALTWMARNRPKTVVTVEDLETVEALHPGREPAFGADVPPTPEAILLSAQQGCRVMDALNALPLPFREVLVMRELEDLSYREIADILEIPVGTVMSRLSRARTILARTLAAELR